MQNAYLESLVHELRWHVFCNCQIVLCFALEIYLIQTGLEEGLGSLLHEVQNQKGDEQYPSHYVEERQTSYSGHMPGLFKEEVPNWQGCLAQHFLKTSASG